MERKGRKGPWRSTRLLRADGKMEACITWTVFAVRDYIHFESLNLWICVCVSPSMRAFHKTDKKQEVEIATKQKLQEILDYYQSGLNIREVKLLNVFAPEQVKDAFDDVVRAKEDKARIINLADAYKESVLPAARGESSKRLQDAEGFRQEKIAEANGEAGRFTAIQREYAKSKDITRKRMYLEAMEEILPNINKVLGDPSQVILVNPESNNVIPVPTQGVGE